MNRFTCFVGIVLGLCACGDDGDTGVRGGPSGSGSGGGGGAGGQPVDKPQPAVDWSRDIVSTGLDLDLTTLKGRATIALAASESTAASFEIGDLAIESVTDGGGELLFVAGDGRLDVGVPSGDGDATVVVDYVFAGHSNFDGWMPDSGVSLLWPEFRGNLFPCKSAPAEGVAFTMTLTGVAAGLTAVHPTSIPTDAPAYMPGIAVAAFEKMDLGTTALGTQVSVWHLPAEEAAAASGTVHLREVFEFYETTYGAYPFGDSVGSVSADWGTGDFGGMEHHPFWHVASGSMQDQVVHAHEAAHGWFGNGVRIACWEDFVLSEGTVTYMAARALEAVGVDAWAAYECDLEYVCTSSVNTIALPETCDRIDILTDPLWSRTPYVKGAYFFREVGALLGPAVVDDALAEFYAAHVGGAARMQDLLDLLATKTDAAGAAALDQLATDWLRTLACPVDTAQLCP